MIGEIRNTQINSNSNTIQESNVQASQNINGKHRFITKAKQIFTKILDKLHIIKQPLNSHQTSSSKHSVAKPDDAENYKDLYDKINFNNAKETWQKGLINIRTTKGVEAWANAVANNFKKGTSNFNAIFSGKEGVFSLDKLSAKELSALSNALGEIKKEDSLEMKSLKTFFYVKNQNTSLSNKYASFCNLEKEFHTLLNEELKTTNDDKTKHDFLTKNTQIFKVLTNMSNEFFEPKGAHTVSTAEDLMDNYCNMLFFQHFMRLSMPMMEALKKPGGEGFQEISVVVSNQSKVLDIMNKTNNYLLENPKTQIDETINLSSMSIQEFDKFVEKYLSNEK